MSDLMFYILFASVISIIVAIIVWGITKVSNRNNPTPNEGLWKNILFISAITFVVAGGSCWLTMSSITDGINH